jgi:hypothetical protein
LNLTTIGTLGPESAGVGVAVNVGVDGDVVGVVRKTVDVLIEVGVVVAVLATDGEVVGVTVLGTTGAT